MPYQKKEWCPHPSHIDLSRSGSKPLYPVGRRIIDAREAELFNSHIMLNSEWTSVTIKAGNKVCQTCFNSLPDLMKACLDIKPISVETPEGKYPELPRLDTQLKRNFARDELNRVFQLLNLETIRDE